MSSLHKFAVHTCLEEISHILPTDGPIKGFIHHNPLHAWEKESFDRAYHKASSTYNSALYAEPSEYQKLYKEKKISDEALSWAKKICKETPQKPLDNAREEWMRNLRHKWLTSLELDLDLHVHPMLFRLLSSFLDQGLSIVEPPNAHLSFWESLQLIIKESYLPMIPLSDPLGKKMLFLSPEEAIVLALEGIIGSDETLYQEYIQEMLLLHKGWSGMVSVIEKNPSKLLVQKTISLVELVAVELILEMGWLRRKCKKRFVTLTSFSLAMKNSFEPSHDASTSSQLYEKKLFHEAFEWTYYFKTLRELYAHIHKPTLTPHTTNTPSETLSPPHPTPTIQAFFCIDDRECSLRRYLEKELEGLRTFSTPGHFGLTFVFKPHDSHNLLEQCPAAFSPRHLIREVKINPDLEQATNKYSMKTMTFSRHIQDLFLPQILGIGIILKMAWQILRPGFRLPNVLMMKRAKKKMFSTTRLLFEKKDTPSLETPHGYIEGFSYQEMAQSISALFYQSDIQTFSQLFVIIGHGSTSANNPYFAAYECGACSGHNGAPNARLFALMANHKEVRKELETTYNILLPADLHVLGAFHDTTLDTITYFDLENLPPTHQTLFDIFDKATQNALKKNAKERCQKFELAPSNLTEEAALYHVYDRATSIFEVRPEYNHATNALCIVGRRELSRGLSFDRRAFLMSYNPFMDPDGSVLLSTLSLLMPVVGGINLEYFFSKMDTKVFGAGSKLSHNIVSLLGVAHGVEGDLLTGLPTQMVEIHEAIRLLLIVEKEPELLINVLKKHPNISFWMTGHWVRLFALHPRTQTFYWYYDKEFHLFEELKEYRG